MENLETRPDSVDQVTTHAMNQEKVAAAITEAVTNGKTDSDKLVEKKKTDKKKFTKEEVKAIKDKIRGTNRAENGNLVCVACGKPILKGQSFKEIPRDAKHAQRRPYHSATCGVGSKAWAKMSGSKQSADLAEKKAKKETEKKVRPVKTAKPKKEKKPIPEPTGKKLHIDTKFGLKKYERYPLEKMAVGDFFIEETKGQDSVRRLSNRFAHKRSWKFSIRKIEDGFRCARIK